MVEEMFVFDLKTRPFVRGENIMICVLHPDRRVCFIFKNTYPDIYDLLRVFLPQIYSSECTINECIQGSETNNK